MTADFDARSAMVEKFSERQKQQWSTLQCAIPAANVGIAMFPWHGLHIPIASLII